MTGSERLQAQAQDTKNLFPGDARAGRPLVAERVRDQHMTRPVQSTTMHGRVRRRQLLTMAHSVRRDDVNTFF